MGLRLPGAIALCTVAACTVALGGCGGKSGPGVSDDELARAVLLGPDLTKDYKRVHYDEIDVEDIRPNTPREALDRFDRVNGWLSRFQRAKKAQQKPGPLIVESRVDLFPDAKRAGQDYAAMREEFDQFLATASGAAETVKVPQIGQGAMGLEFRHQSGPNVVRFYTVGWRQGPFTATVAVEGFAGKVTIDDAVALARKQEARIRPLLSG